jgi:hypothetical protein
MKSVASSKFLAPSLFITFVLFTPFILPGKSPTHNKTITLPKRRSGHVSPAPIHWVSQFLQVSDPGHGVVSPPLRAPQISPEFARFIDHVFDGQSGVVRGIYVADVLALSVVQQPAKDWTYVSSKLGDATEFQSASKNGILGLLAHNYLSGRSFYNLKPGEQVDVVYGDGAVKYYRVSNIYQYQKIDPTDLSSNLVDLSTGKIVSSGHVFEQFYDGSDHVTLQTCLEKNGLSTWGLYFVVAQPIPASN